MRIRQLKIFSIAALLLLTYSLSAQNSIGLDEYIRLALERNYSLKMSRNDMVIAENNVTIAPFLPTVAATGKQVQENQTAGQTDTENGGTISDKVRTNTSAAGVAMTWTIFDGLAMFTSYSRQKELLALSSQSVKVEVENLIMRICSEYYNIIVQQHLLNSELTSLALSKSRYANAEEKYLLGVISGLDLQQAKIDLNADSSIVLNQSENVRSAYIRLSNMLNAGPDEKYSIHDTIILAQAVNYDTLKQRTLKYNNQLIMARQGESISEKDLELVRAARYPTINFSSGYNFSRYEYPWNNNNFSQTKGMYYGLNVSWNIFSGLETRRMINNAKINAENSKLAYLDAENQIVGDLNLLYNNYLNNITVTNFETESTEVARKSLEIAMERYRLGSLSGLEFREYQNKYLEAINRRLTALYQAKISEIGLRLLCGELTE